MTSLPTDFRALSARLGQDPLQVQGAGGNTSFKDGAIMWIKASGTELADAQEKDIFVAVDRDKAKAEAYGAGDGTCKAAVLDPQATLRPSIETTFHALLDWKVVAHTHSVATLVHGISDTGCAEAMRKLQGLPVAVVPYRKPGVPLTGAIATAITPNTQVIILQNHGLVCAADSVEEVSELIANVEARLIMPLPERPCTSPAYPAPDGYDWFEYAAPLARDPRLRALVTQGSYYPDHVVFLGPALPTEPGGVAVVCTDGVALRKDATSAQRAMLRCVMDVLGRLPEDWPPHPIGAEAEAALLNWDAEKYRQALAAKPAP